MPAHRKPYVGVFASQIALSKGHTFVSEVMLNAGSPSKDKRGRDLMHYVKLSKSDFVVSHVKLLLEPFASDQAPFRKTMEFLTTSGCLDYARWGKCNISRSTDPISNGTTFPDVIRVLCSEKFAHLAPLLYSHVSAIVYNDGDFGSMVDLLKRGYLSSRK